jgi:hypothetical protein
MVPMATLRLRSGSLRNYSTHIVRTLDTYWQLSTLGHQGVMSRVLAAVILCLLTGMDFHSASLKIHIVIFLFFNTHVYPLV